MGGLPQSTDYSAILPRYTFPPSKIFRLFPEELGRKGGLMHILFCICRRKDFSSPFTGCDKPASLNPSIQMDELITKGATDSQ